MSKLTFSHRDAVDVATRQWRKRKVLPTRMGSAELRGVARSVRQRSVFSARTANIDYVAEIHRVVDQVLTGKINMSTGRWKLLRKLGELGYDASKGFPGELTPPAERGSLQDLSSTRRLDLVLQTNVRMAVGLGQKIGGGRKAVQRRYPAWQLVRIYTRAVPRGEKKRKKEIVADPKNAWETRWKAAGEAVGWEGASKERMVALKTSPIWQALGDGAGDYRDVLDNDYPPFAFGSGRGWRSIAKAICLALGLITKGWQPKSASKKGSSLAPKASEVARVKTVLSTFGEEEQRELFAQLDLDLPEEDIPQRRGGAEGEKTEAAPKKPATVRDLGDGEVEVTFEGGLPEA